MLFRIGSSAGGGEELNLQVKAFSIHIIEAIQINFKRRKYYAACSKGKSLAISYQLIFSEILVLPFAFVFDLWAHKYNKMGIPIVQQDVVSMQHIYPENRPPKYIHAIISEDTKKLLSGQLNRYRKELGRYIKHNDFYTAAVNTQSQIEKLILAEERYRAHFAMTIHLLESMGYMIANAIDYQKQSKGKTNALSKTLIYFHLYGINAALQLDYKAQKMHQQGIGIIVNDIPSIPFLEKMSALKIR